jgi:aminomethyltransferase
MDLSPLRKFELTGPDAEALLQYCLTRDVRRLAVGQVVYTAMCYAHGGMIDDGTLFRLGHNNFRWIGGDDFSGIWLRQQAEKMGFKAWVRSSTDQLHNIAVQGPKSRELLSEIIWTAPAQPAISELGWFRFAIGRIGHFEGAPVVISRTGYTGELGYEIFCHPKDALAVFDAVWEAGQGRGIKPLGLEALDMLRIEAGLLLIDVDFVSSMRTLFEVQKSTPYELGLGWTVALGKPCFVGQEALRREKERGPAWTTVGLVLDLPALEAVYAGFGMPLHLPYRSWNDAVPIYADAERREQVGKATSGTWSPILKSYIAIARVLPRLGEPGGRVFIEETVEARRFAVPARVVKLPFFDPPRKKD